ncbi:MAG: FAD-dependent oxidoreductase [bacterium]
MARKNKITLVGAGPAGSLLAIYLARRGFAVEIFERRPDMRKVDVSAGRSINLALSTRGLHALREAGLFDHIMKIAVPMKGRMMHAVDGALTFQRYGKDDSEVIYAVLRGELNKALLAAAERYENVEIHFNRRCTDMDFDTGEIELLDETNAHKTKIAAEVVIGTDGSASAIRFALQKAGRFNFSQEYLEHGYKELTIPAGAQGEFLLEKNALHIWPRRTFMLIALPNTDGSFACIFFFPHTGEPSFARLSTAEKVLRFFQEQFSDAVQVMPNLLPSYFANPTGAMVTIRCAPWHVGGKVLLLGDAAHAIVPFFGQGVNCAFEDCTVLDACMDEFRGDWEEIFLKFEALRKENTDAIADLALENFIEMRDLVADPQFLLKKKVEQALQQRFPDIFIPKYAMVTFHRLPYARALAKGEIQDKILEELCAAITGVEELDWDKAGKLVRQELSTNIVCL